MNRRKILALYAVALCAGTMTSSGAIAQQKSLKEQLVGNWTFVASIDTNRDGTKTDRFGPNAKGLVMFDASGRFSFLISRASIPKFAVNNVNQVVATVSGLAVVEPRGIEPLTSSLRSGRRSTPHGG